ncbi:class I SAM-dependent methyltransferase [Aliamphritea ceti]|uniref:class I SAM-dependent methyltransferase n=1 Tax=Aliamphritea ceti TaxID=1524258 RepID=UPI0021C39BBF|nr:class I SAM-dependent methyltransferase [Aliamphritea ceti]
MIKADNTDPDAKFWNRIAKRYAKQTVTDQLAYETKLAKTDSILQPEDRVLEIGCGTGSTAIHHAPRVSHIKALDISERMIEIARQKVSVAGISNVEFDVQTASVLAYPPQSFDVVMAHSILHLMADVDQVLSNIQQMLKPDGLLISSTAFIRDDYPWLRYIAPLGRKTGLLPRVNVFTEKQFIQWLETAGFIIEERWQPKPKSGVYIIARSKGQ